MRLVLILAVLLARVPSVVAADIFDMVRDHYADSGGVRIH
jgi:hypothetical protein